MKKSVARVELGYCHFEDSGYQASDGDYWTASTLYEAARKQKCKEYWLPISHIDLSDCPFTGASIYHYAYHANRMMKTDLRYPILVGPLGNIMDGWHRVGKCLIERKLRIKAIRLDALPDTDEQPVTRKNR